jgi:hypothetical protein
MCLIRKSRRCGDVRDGKARLTQLIRRKIEPQTAQVLTRHNAKEPFEFSRQMSRVDLDRNGDLLQVQRLERTIVQQITCPQEPQRRCSMVQPSSSAGLDKMIDQNPLEYEPGEIVRT